MQVTPNDFFVCSEQRDSSESCLADRLLTLPIKLPFFGQFLKMLMPAYAELM